MANSLLIDIGNSRLKWAIHRDETWIIGTPLSRVDEPFEYDAIWLRVARPSRVLVSSVLGPSVNESLRQWVEEHWSLPVEFVFSRDKALGVTNGYRNPRQLGVDRWVAMIAARGLYREATLVVDCGTAITVDLLDDLGLHRGGVICPGLELMRQELQRKSPALIPDTENGGGSFGRDTGAGILIGSVLAASGLIEKCFEQARRLLSGPLNVLITGGDAAMIAARLQVEHVLLPDLVLRGLARIEREGDGADFS